MQSLDHRQGGFTLIELMVVIVIISIMAALVVMNIGGIDQRKAMQAREALILDLKRIQREAVDQSLVVALVPQWNGDQFSYTFQKYNDLTRPEQTLVSNNNRQPSIWVEMPEFSARELPAKVSFQIESSDYSFENATNADLMNNNAPKLIWLGNGEVKPVTIQMYYEQKAIGDLIQIDYLGKIDAGA